MKIGNKILNIRNEKNMTQSEFAELFSVSRQAVSNWENNKSYPDLETIIKISEKFDIPLDQLLKEDMDMVKTVDKNKRKVKVLKYFFIASIVFIIAVAAYIGICNYQHKVMYNKVLSIGFKKEMTPEFIERYQGYYALSEDGVDYLVEPKAIGSLSLDLKKFELIARKGSRDITIQILSDGKIDLSLYPGSIEVDEEGEIKGTTENLTKSQRDKLNDLLIDRKEETVKIIKSAYKKWKQINAIS